MGPPAAECPICFEPIKPSELVRAGCSHEFCRPCLLRWQHASKQELLSCPMCRSIAPNHLTVNESRETVWCGALVALVACFRARLSCIYLRK